MDTSSQPAAIGHKDRRSALAVFGGLTILAGLFFALMSALTLIMGLGTLQAASGLTLRTALPAVVLYIFLGVGLVWLGIGSIQGRRWARAFLLILSWSTLFVGIISIFLVAIMIPNVMANVPAAPGAHQPAPIPGWVSVVPLIFMAIIYVLFPFIYIRFYGSRHTRATVEEMDPVERWTDRSPLPVIALSAWLMFGAAMLLLLPVGYNGLIPFFGIFLTGIWGTLLCVISAVIWVYCALRIYHLDLTAWWIAFVAFCAFTISSGITYAGADMIQVYTLMGYSDELISQLKATNMFQGRMFLFFLLFSTIPWLIYMLYAKRFFPSKTASGS